MKAELLAALQTGGVETQNETAGEPASEISVPAVGEGLRREASPLGPPPAEAEGDYIPQSGRTAASQPPLGKGAWNGRLIASPTAGTEAERASSIDPAAASQIPAERVCAHLDSLAAQAEELRTEFPDFDLGAALGDPDFLRLTAPGTGVDLRRAYYALHREELDLRAARRAARESRAALARSLAAGMARPREGGGLAAGALTAGDYGALSRPEQQAVKQRIREAAARGEKIYPPV